MLLYRREAETIPNQGLNEHKSQLTEGAPSAALTVALAPAPPALLIPGGWRIEDLPGTVREAGPSAERRLLEFFTAEISNPNTRLAYAAAAARFFQWCETRNLALRAITPFAVATYIEEMQDRYTLPTMVYSFARVGAMVSMNVEDYYRQGKRWWLRLHEKGGKFHQVPAHHNAEEYLDAYLEAARIGNEKGTPLWRSMAMDGTFSRNRMSRVDVFRMVKRRVRQAELGVPANCHTFRATGITAYLLNGGSVENAQAIAAHESPRTTNLYDRTADEISLDEIERIVI